jgi:hypothetical protein
MSQFTAETIFRIVGIQISDVAGHKFLLSLLPQIKTKLLDNLKEVDLNETHLDNYFDRMERIQNLNPYKKYLFDHKLESLGYTRGYRPTFEAISEDFKGTPLTEEELRDNMYRCHLSLEEDEDQKLTDILDNIYNGTKIDDTKLIVQQLPVCCNGSDEFIIGILIDTVELGFQKCPPLSVSTIIATSVYARDDLAKIGLDHEAQLHLVENVCICQR